MRLRKIYVMSLGSNSLLSKISIGLNLIFYLNFSLLIFEAYKLQQLSILPLFDFGIYIVILFLIAAIYVGKTYLLRALGNVLLSQKAFDEYLHNVFVFNKAFGLILFPAILGIPFASVKLTQYLLIYSLAAFAIFYVLRLIRGIQIIISKHISILFLILYLCTLEILPLTILYKIVRTYIL